MSVWIIGTGNISIKPQVDDTLIKEYIQFSKRCIPVEYGEESFPNTWFFDENNKLVSIAGKFAEPSIWYSHIKEKFFEVRGYELEGDMIIVGEADLGFEETREKNREKYQQWKLRILQYSAVLWMIVTTKFFIELFQNRTVVL